MKTNTQLFQKCLTFSVILLVIISQFTMAVRTASAVSGDISGTILGADGSPLTGVAIQVDALLKSDLSNIATTFSNPANGTYNLHSLPFDTEIVVLASGEDPDTDGYYAKYYNHVTNAEWAVPFTLTDTSPSATGVDIKLTTGVGAAEQLTFNVRSGRILSDFVVRQAIAWGFSRDTLLEWVFEPRGVTGTIMNTMVYPGVWYEAPPSSLEVYSYNPIIAGNLLDGAGWDTFNADGYREKDSVELALDLITTDAEVRIASATFIKSELAAIGIRINLFFYPSSIFFSSDPAVSPLLMGNFDIAEFAWIIDDSDSFTGGMLTAGHEQNYGGYDLSTLDDYYYAARDAKVAGTSAFITNALNWQVLFSMNVPIFPLFLRQNTGESMGVINVSKDGTGDGSVFPSNIVYGIFCGTDCTESLVHGTTVVLTAEPTPSSLFTGWSGACTGTGTCTITVDDSNDVTATFTLKDYNLTVSKLGTGSGTVTSTPVGIDCGGDCAQAYPFGTVVKLTATASAGSLFTGWSGAGCSGLKFCWVTMNATKSVTATFTTIPAGTYPVTVVKGGTGSGTVTSLPAGISCGTDCWEFYTAGTVVKLIAAASPGSTFIGWSGACGSMDNCFLLMGAPKYVTANFALTPPGTFPLIVAMKGKGTGTVTSNVPGISCWPDCYEFYARGTLVRLAAVAAPGSTFMGWSGACGGVAYCWVTMSQARFVTANWALTITSVPPLEADLALIRDPFAFFTFLTKPLEGMLP